MFGLGLAIRIYLAVGATDMLTRMPDVLDSGPGRDAFARPSRFNR